MAPRDLRDNDILEMPAFPADPPDPDPSDTAAVASVIHEVTELAEHELLSVLGLAEKREKFFVKAVALVFEANDGTEPHVGIRCRRATVGGTRSRCSRAEGRKKIGIMGSLRDRNGAVESLLGRDLLERRSEDSEVAVLRRATDTFRSRVQELEEQMPAAGVEGAEDLAPDRGPRVGVWTRLRRLWHVSQYASWRYTNTRSSWSRRLRLHRTGCSSCRPGYVRR